MPAVLQQHMFRS